MKRFLTAIFTCAVTVAVTGCATTANVDKGTWGVSGKAGMGGYLDLLTDDKPENEDKKVVFEDVGDKIFGNLDLKYQKPITDGTFSAIIGVDYFRGISAELGWEQVVADGNFTAGISFNRDDTWNGGWPAIVISSGYDTGKFGITAAAYNSTWSLRSINDFRLLHFRWEPITELDNSDNKGFDRGAILIEELNGYYLALDDQLKIDLSYREMNQEWRKTYRDYFRASNIVARNWFSGDQTIAVSYKPAFLGGKLNAGVAFTNIAMTDNTKNYFLSTDHEADPPKHGAFERTVFGLKYELGDNMAFSAQFNMGDTGGVNGWWFLVAPADNKDAEDGYFDIIGSNPSYPSRVEMGFNLGARVDIAGFNANADAEVIGFSDITREGMMAAGAKLSYSASELFTPSLTFRLFNWIGTPELFTGGLLGLHPEVVFNIVPQNLAAGLRVDYVTGTGETLANFNFVKLNPKIWWTINGDERTKLELGYTYRYDFNEFESGSREHAVKLNFEWNF